MTTKNLIAEIKKNLTRDLLKPQYKSLKRPFAGHCYVASEVLYHMLGNSWKPMVARYRSHGKSLTHWFLQHKVTGEILDPTQEQFTKPFPYHTGIGTGFLTKHPSKRAQIILGKLKNI